MIKINLLPVRQAAKVESARRELGLLAFVGVLVLLGSLAGWVLTRAQLAATNQANGALEQEILRLKADADRVDEMEKFEGELERKLEVIGQLRSAKQGPVHMLDDLATATPERLTVVELEEKGGNIRLTGLSVSNEIISQFLRALEASEYFEAVYLEDIEAKSATAAQGSVMLKEFKLTARLVTPPPKKADPQGGGATPPGSPATPDQAPAAPGAAPGGTTGALPAPTRGGGA